MAENEKTLGELLYSLQYPGSYEAGCWDRESDMTRAKNEKDAQVVAAEAVRRWIADLPAGDGGLAQAYLDAHDALIRGRDNVVPLDFRDIFARFPFVRECMKNAIAAVLEVHRARLRESAPQDELRHSPWVAVPIIERLDAEGWLPPDEAEEMKANLAQLMPERETLRGEVTKLRVEIERLRHQLAEARAENERLIPDVKTLQKVRDAFMGAARDVSEFYKSDAGSEGK